MSRHIGFSPEAEHELDDALAWYDERSPGLGDEFAAAVDDAVASIHRIPRAGSPIGGADDDLDIRRVATRRFPYQVIYLTTDTTVVILAVAHQHRRPDYWVHRASVEDQEGT